MQEPSAGHAHAPIQRRGALAVLLGSRESIAGTVYGTVIVMATIAAGSKGGLAPNVLLASMVSAVLVLWVAHVYARALELSIQSEHRLEWHEFVRVAHHEWSIALAAVPPGIPLLLGSLGWIKESTAVWLALVAGLVVLAVQGVRYATLERLTPLGTVISVTLNLALGLAIVLLKALVSH